MNTFSKIIKSYVFYTLSALGISFGIIANIGVSSYNSMNLALANASSIKIGTVTIFFNMAFLILYMILSKFHYKYKYAMQTFSVFMFGILINYFTYSVLVGITDLSYLQRILIFSGGTLVGGLSLGMIVHYNVITFPLESLCVIISNSSRFSFVQLRYGVDVIAITVSLLVSVTNGLPLYVREGTLISMVLLSYMMNLSKTFAESKLKKETSLLNSNL